MTICAGSGRKAHRGMVATEHAKYRCPVCGRFVYTTIRGWKLYKHAPLKRQPNDVTRRGIPFTPEAGE